MRCMSFTRSTTWSISRSRSFLGNAACGRSRTQASTAERSEELGDFPGERARLLERREVAAFLHHAPAADIGVGLRGQRARRAQDFLRKLRVAHRHADGLERPGAVK